LEKERKTTNDNLSIYFIFKQKILDFFCIKWIIHTNDDIEDDDEDINHHHLMIQLLAMMMMISNKRSSNGMKINNFFRIKICFIRAMEIERSREKSLRRQFEYIVHSVKVSSFISLYTNICFFKELERRRQQRRRTKSPEYYEKTISPSRRRHLHSHSVENKIHK
jgi:hypothetical protein